MFGYQKSWYQGLRWKTALAAFAAVSIGSVSIAAACVKPAASASSGKCPATTTTTSTTAMLGMRPLKLRASAFQLAPATAGKPVFVLQSAAISPTVTAVPVANYATANSTDPIASALSFLNGAGIDLGSILTTIQGFGISPDTLVSAATGASNTTTGSGNTASSVTSAITSLATGALASGSTGTSTSPSGSTTSGATTTGSVDPAVILGALSAAGINLGDLLTALEAQGLDPMALESILTPGGVASLDPATITKIQAAVMQASGGDISKLVSALTSANVDPSIVSVLINSGGGSTTGVIPTPPSTSGSVPPPTSTGTAPGTSTSGGTTSTTTGSTDPAVILNALSAAGVNLGDLLTALEAQGLDPMALQTILTPGGAASLDPATKAKVQAAVLQVTHGDDSKLIASLQAANVDPSVIGVLTNAGSGSAPAPAPTPPVTTPPATIPDVTVPDVTVPDVTVPDVTVPDVTVPDVTVPDTTPATTPPVTTPNSTTPVHCKPVKGDKSVCSTTTTTAPSSVTTLPPATTTTAPVTTTTVPATTSTTAATTTTTTAPASTGSTDPAVILNALSAAGVNLGDLLTALEAQGLDPMALQTILTPGGAASLDPATKAKVQAAVLQVTHGDDSKLIASLQAANVDPSVIGVLTTSTSTTSTTLMRPLMGACHSAGGDSKKSHKSSTTTTPSSVSSGSGSSTSGATSASASGVNVSPQVIAAVLQLLSALGINVNDLVDGAASLGIG